MFQRRSQDLQLVISHHMPWPSTLTEWRLSLTSSGSSCTASQPLQHCMQNEQLKDIISILQMFQRHSQDLQLVISHHMPWPSTLTEWRLSLTSSGSSCTASQPLQHCIQNEQLKDIISILQMFQRRSQDLQLVISHHMPWPSTLTEWRLSLTSSGSSCTASQPLQHYMQNEQLKDIISILQMFQRRSQDLQLVISHHMPWPSTLTEWRLSLTSSGSSCTASQPMPTQHCMQNEQLKDITSILQMFQRHSQDLQLVISHHMPWPSTLTEWRLSLTSSGSSCTDRRTSSICPWGSQLVEGKPICWCTWLSRCQVGRSRDILRYLQPHLPISIGLDIWRKRMWTVNNIDL